MSNFLLIVIFYHSKLKYICYIWFRNMHAQAKGRGRHSYGEIPVWRMKEVIQEAKAIAFPWDAIPSPIKKWLKAMGGAINTQPEFLLIGAMTVASCLMGPDSFFEIRKRHVKWRI